jgi:hypothetical protein
MIPISSSVAFWILDAYRRIGSQLHFRGVFKGEKFEWGATVESTTIIGDNISLKLFDWSDGQKGEWRESISLADVKQFFFDPISSSDSKTNSVLTVEFKSSDDVFVFAEAISSTK